MGITTVTITELYRHPGRVKKAAKQGPIFITRYGRVAYVLMTFDEYTKLTGVAEKAGKQTEE